jgi:GntR family transcriptional regulator
MLTLQPVAKDQRLPSERIVGDLREQIANGALAPGDQIPTVAQLCAAYEVSRVTALKAVAVLREEGLVVTTPRWGTFVK